MYNSGTTSMLISSTCRYFISDGEFQESRKKAKVKITKVQDVKAFSELQNNQNPLLSIPLLKHLKKKKPNHLAAQLIQRTERYEGKWLVSHPPSSSALVFFVIEEICLPPSFYQVLATAQEGCISPATPQEDSTTLGISPSHPKAFYLISIHTLSSLPTPHIFKLTSTYLYGVGNTIPTITWWRKH